MNIQEIAKLAGVSISTVSKVMNGKDKDIGEETREKVMRIVEENHYMPYAKRSEEHTSEPSHSLESRMPSSA